MQQAIYNSISIQADAAAKTNRTGNTGGLRTAGVLRWVSRKLDLIGVLALMGSSAVYGVFALTHVGL